MASTEDEDRRLTSDRCGWLRFRAKGAAGVTASDAARQAATARWIRRCLFRRTDPVPGMILGDEVGMGKTFEVFGVIAPLLRVSKRARVVVLAHNQEMARTWYERWNEFIQANVTCVESLPKGEIVQRASDLTDYSLVFASYERVKRVPTAQQRVMLEAAMARPGLTEVTRKQLRYRLFGSRRRVDLPEKVPSRSRLNEFWRAQYGGRGAFTGSDWAVKRELNILAHAIAQKGRAIDLLVVDEAHKLESQQRQVFFREALGGRARRVLLVTATPFALEVGQLISRIEDILQATGASAPERRRKESLEALLNSFEGALDQDGDVEKAYKLRPLVQAQLRRYLVRSTWKDTIAGGILRRRYLPPLRATPQHGSVEERTFASLALETAFRRLEGTAQTHRASYRETLCSSYAAIHDSVARRSEDKPLPGGFAGLVSLLPDDTDSPKLECAAEWLAEQARSRKKVVVFCKRLATISKLRTRIRAATLGDLHEDRVAWARYAGRRAIEARSALSEDGQLWRAQLRHAIHEGRRPDGAGRYDALVKDLRERLEAAGTYGTSERAPELWAGTFGSKRQVEWIRRLVGGMGKHDRGHTQEEVLFEFNLPGPPYILLCSPTAKEGIDLHRWCRRVMLYDLEWNPAAMEQQIGRVDRMNSYSRRLRAGASDAGSTDVFFVWQPRTYEERIQGRVERRLRMMQVLLGAGRWFQHNPETELDLPQVNLAKLAMSFSPR